MRRGAFARGARRAGVEQDDRLACRARPFGKRQEACGLAELLDDHRDRLRRRISDQMLDIILDARRRFVPGRYRRGDAEILRHQRGAQHHRHRPRLADDAHRRLVGQVQHRHLDKGQRHPGGIVDQPQAVRPLDDHVMLGRDPRDLRLRGQPLLTPFGEARRKDDRRADPARRQRPHRVQHRRPRNRQHRRIDPHRQLVDRLQAGPPVDHVALGIDEVDVAGIAMAFEVAQHRIAQRPRRRRRTDDDDRTGGEQAGKVGHWMSSILPGSGRWQRVSADGGGRATQRDRSVCRHPPPPCCAWSPPRAGEDAIVKPWRGPCRTRPAPACSSSRR